MRLKTVLIMSGLCLLITLFLIEYDIASQTYNSCDMVEINDTYKTIEGELGKRPAAEVEKKYGCQIILSSQSNYSNELYQAIRNSDIILDYLKGDRLLGKIIFPSDSSTFTKLKQRLQTDIFITFLAVAAVLTLVICFLYKRILVPFHRLERFAGNISVGNLDIPLTMDRSNYFGAFTESFDLMREELKKARQGEYEANISKKELVAELSHDIKTPVATIKALCELLEVKVKEEDTVAKLHTIDQKADVIDKLISNMFHATLEELAVLKIEPREEYSTILTQMLEDLNYYGRIQQKNELPKCLIYCDKLRLNQVIDNIVNNSYKYAQTQIDVTYSENPGSIELELRDYGSSISDGDLPLVFEKFYRGENAAAHSGSGLGLYLSKQFMEGMGGSVECRSEHGFIVKLVIQKV